MMKLRTLLMAVLPLMLLGAATPVPGTSTAQSVTAYAPKRFSVVVKGSGPDVILIPGLASSRDVWSGTAAAVPGYRYHLLQVAGFAGEKAGANAQGEVLAPLAEEIARYIAANHLQRPAIVGHSMGGTLAMMVAARHPSLVGKVMVVDMYPQPAGLFGSTASGLSGLADSLGGLTATPGGRQLVASVVELFAPPHKDDSRSDPDVVARATRELALTDLTPELPGIAAPLTVVYASPDPTQSAALQRSFASAYAAHKGTKLIRVENSGHMIMYDQPQRFQATLKDFLKD